MARALPSAVPPKMYRHFALVTVLLTLGIAMFADGENREAAAAQVERREEREQIRRDDAAEAAGPAIVRRSPVPRRERPRQHIGFDGFDPSFGAPMDSPMRSLASYATGVASAATQAGYPDAYLASLGAEERALLVDGLEKEGMLSRDERERKSAALIAASEARGGGSVANY